MKLFQTRLKKALFLPLLCVICAASVFGGLVTLNVFPRVNADDTDGGSSVTAYTNNVAPYATISGDEAAYGGSYLDLNDDITKASYSDNKSFYYVNAEYGKSVIFTFDKTINWNTIKVHYLVADGFNPLKEAKISYSDNGTDYTDWDTITATETENGNYWAQKTSTAISSKYVKLTFYSTTSFLAIDEVQICADEPYAPSIDGCSNIALNTKIEAGTDSHTSFEGAVSSLTDGQAISHYSSGYGGGNWVFSDFTIDLGEQKTWNTIKVQGFCGADGVQPITRIYVYASNDGTTWTDVGNISIDSSVTGAYEFKRVFNATVTSQYIKAYIGGNNGMWCIGEITVLGAHNLTEHKKVEATRTEEGTKKYYDCSVCGKKYTLNAEDYAYEVVSDESSLVIPKVTATVEGGNECNLALSVDVDKKLSVTKNPADTKYGYKKLNDGDYHENEFPTSGGEVYYASSDGGADVIFEFEKSLSFNTVKVHHLYGIYSTPSLKSIAVSYSNDNETWVSLGSENLRLPEATNTTDVLHGWEEITSTAAVNAKYVKVTFNSGLYYNFAIDEIQIIGGHDIVKKEEVPATFLSTGVKEHYECSVCGKKYLLDEEAYAYKLTSDKALLLEKEEATIPSDCNVAYKKGYGTLTNYSDKKPADLTNGDRETGSIWDDNAWYGMQTSVNGGIQDKNLGDSVTFEGNDGDKVGYRNSVVIDLVDTIKISGVGINFYNLQANGYCAQAIIYISLNNSDYTKFCEVPIKKYSEQPGAYWSDTAKSEITPAYARYVKLEVAYQNFCFLNEIEVYGEHPLTLVEKVEATDGKDGVEEHYKCSVCGKIYTLGEGNVFEETSLDELTAHGCSTSTKVEEVKATTEAYGKKEYYTCLGCTNLFVLDSEGNYVVTTEDELILAPIAYKNNVAAYATIGGDEAAGDSFTYGRLNDPTVIHTGSIPWDKTVYYKGNNPAVTFTFDKTIKFNTVRVHNVYGDHGMREVTSIEVSYSNDSGVTYTIWKTQSVNLEVSNGTDGFKHAWITISDIPANAKIVKVKFNSAGSVGIDQVEIYAEKTYNPVTTDSCNFAKGKTATVSKNNVYNGQSVANLTDGISSTETFNANGGKDWYGLQGANGDTFGDLSGIEEWNGTDNYGKTASVVITLNETVAVKFSTVRMHIYNLASSEGLINGYVLKATVYTSSDGSTYSSIGDLAVKLDDEHKNKAYWAELKLDSSVSANYVKIEFLYKTFAFFNEVEVLGEHAIKSVAEKPVTAGQDGVRAHYECDNCKKWYSLNEDAYAYEELTDEQKSGLTFHDYQLVAEKPATIYAEGVRAHYECIGCNTKRLTKYDANVNDSDLAIPKLEISLPEGLCNVAVGSTVGGDAAGGTYSYNYLTDGFEHRDQFELDSPTIYYNSNDKHLTFSFNKAASFSAVEINDLVYGTYGCNPLGTVKVYYSNDDAITGSTSWTLWKTESTDIPASQTFVAQTILIEGTAQSAKHVKLEFLTSAAVEWGSFAIDEVKIFAPHDIIEVAEKAATVTSTGESKHHECSVCGKKFIVDDTTDPANPVYTEVDDDYFVTERLTGFFGASMAVNNNFDVNFYAHVAGSPSNVLLSCTFNGSTSQISGTHIGNGEYVFTFKKVGPQNLGKTISAELKVDGAVKETKTFTPTEYLKSVFDQGDDEQKRLIADIFEYGAAAQAYVGDTSAKINTLYSDIASSATTFVAPTEAKKSGTVHKEVEGFGFVGVGLRISSEVKLVFKFNAGSGYKLYVNDVDVTSKVTALEGGAYEYCTNGISVINFDSTFTAKLYSNSGSTLVQTVNYCVNSYVYAKHNSSDANLANLVKCIYNYGLSAIGAQPVDRSQNRVNVGKDPAVDDSKLTNGVIYKNAKDEISSVYSEFSNGDVILLDLGSVYKLGAFELYAYKGEITQTQTDEEGEVSVVESKTSVLPPYVTVYVSSDGRNWTDVGKCYATKKDQTYFTYVIELSHTREGQYVKFELATSDSSYCCLISEACAYVYSNSLGNTSSPVEGVGCPDPEEIGVAKNVYLAYHQPTGSGIAQSELEKAVAYHDKNGAMTGDAMFDGIIFLANGKLDDTTSYYPGEAMKMTSSSLKSLTTSLFADGVNVKALEAAVAKLKAVSGTKVSSDYKVKVYFSLYYPSGVSDGYSSFGDYTYNGTTISSIEEVTDKAALLNLWIDEIEATFAGCNFENIEIGGYYWYTESISGNQTSVIELIKKHLTEKYSGRKLAWIPYFDASNAQNWQGIGFDIASWQPNYAFDFKVLPDRLDATAANAKQYGTAVELEMDGLGIKDARYRARYYEYLARAKDLGYRDTVHFYYLGGSVLNSLLNDGTGSGRDIYEVTFDFIQDGEISKPQANPVISVEVDAGGSTDITLVSDAKITTSIMLREPPKHGTVTVNADGTVTYHADAGYTGYVSFTYVYANYGVYSNVCNVMINVK